jgi:NTP pyrophosphatase (non-canonical NTP hydrolase)
MDFKEYQQESRRTRSIVNDNDKMLLNGALGAAGEAGEIADLIKKYYFHNHTLKTDDLAKEIGDVLWYLSELSDVIGIPLDVIAQMNIAKLYDRYPNGFSEQRSIDRDK